MAPVELSTSSKLITCPCQESGKPLSLYRSNDRVALSQKPRKISLRMYKRISFNELTNERWVRGKFSTNEELHNPTPIPRISFKHPFRHPSGYDSFFGFRLCSFIYMLGIGWHGELKVRRCSFYIHVCQYELPFYWLCA